MDNREHAGDLQWAWLADAGRLEAVARLEVQRLASNDALAALSRLACTTTDEPFSQISIIGSSQAVPISCGFPTDCTASTPAEDSLCSVTVASGGPFAVADARSHPWIRELPPVTSGQVRAYLGVPIFSAAGDALGAVCAFGPEAREWGPRDIEAMVDVAELVMREIELTSNVGAQASLIDDLGSALQDLVLPTELPDLPTVELAARYEQAASGLMVGGDWYDCFHVADDRFSWAVGDVAGHGLRAAATMAQLRSALRAYALVGGRPGTVLAQLERLLLDIAPETLVALAFGELNPSTGRLRFAVAGITPPLLLSPNGARFLDKATEPPLNARLATVVDPAEQEVVLEPGDVVVLYSDGLIERRDVGIDVGLERLRAFGDTISPGAPAKDICNDIIDAMAVTDTEDDVCVLVVRYLGP